MEGVRGGDRQGEEGSWVNERELAITFDEINNKIKFIWKFSRFQMNMEFENELRKRGQMDVAGPSLIRLIRCCEFEASSYANG